MAGWFYLFVAIVLEVIGTTCMKLSDGFARLLPSIGVAFFYLASLFGLHLSSSTHRCATVRNHGVCPALHAVGSADSGRTSKIFTNIIKKELTFELEAIIFSHHAVNRRT